MFRALTCLSSGGKIVFTQHLVSSLSVNVCTVHWLRAEDNSVTNILLMNTENCALKLVNEIILYYDARSKKYQKDRFHPLVRQKFDKYTFPVRGCIVTLSCSSFRLPSSPWPASWSSGQSFGLLITRSRIRFPALPWEFSLWGEDPRGDHGLGS